MKYFLVASHFVHIPLTNRSRQVAVQALEQENKTLRQMLGIAEQQH